MRWDHRLDAAISTMSYAKAIGFWAVLAVIFALVIRPYL